VLTTVLGFVGNDRISTSIIGTTLKEFPVFGDQIGSNAAHPLTGNTLGLVVGLLGLLYGSLGVAQAAQHAMAQIWK
jgi:membrane protein